MAAKMEAPKMGERYRCAKCKLEVQVTNGCNCQNCEAEFNCCGQSMERVIVPPVQNA
ncbi:MAG: hypothetical protein ACF788_12405 [Novipirellula sp. JB048]